MDGGAIGILVREGEGEWGGVEAAGCWPSGLEVGEGDGAAGVFVERPLDDVEVVGAEVGDVAAGVVVEPAPIRVEAGGAERSVCGGAEPEVVVQSVGDRCGLGLGGVAVVVAVITGEADADLFEFAEAAIADEFGGHAEVNIAALLGAGLPDDIGLANGVTHEAAFSDGEGEGLFAVDVFAGAGGCDGLEGVPVVGGGDLDGVDVWAGEKVAEVFVGGASAALVFGVDHAAHRFAAERSIFADDALVIASGFGFDVAD